MATSKHWLQRALLVTVAMLITLLGCGQTRPSAVEIVQAVQKSADELRTCRFDMTVKAFLSIPGSSTKGALDTVNKRMKLETIVEWAGSGTSTRTESYVLDDVWYWMEEAEGQREWIKRILPGSEAVWETENPVDDVLSLFEQSLEWHTSGDEKVGGIDCYVVEVVPNLSVLQTMLAMVEVDQMTGMSIRFWFAKDTYFPVKVDIFAGAEGVDADFEYEMVLYDHNEPVSVELPPEASSAVWID